MIQLTYNQKTTFIRLAVLITALLSIFLILLVVAKAKELKYIGGGETTNIITVTGEGEVNRAPDTARISFTISNEQKELKVAQNNVSQKVETLTKSLKEIGIEDKQIKTEGYNSYPQYDYPRMMCITTPCPSGSPVLRGYEVSQNIEVRVKDLAKVPEVLAALGKHNVTNTSGPNFGFEDDKAVEREARDMAIEDAKAEAQKLAQALGVKLVRIVSFSENLNPDYGAPIYAMKQESSAGAGDSISLPVGERGVKSRVNLVYQIK